MADRIFGDVPGGSPGHTFVGRAELRAAESVRPPQAGISGSDAEGAESIVLNGGYEDDQDFGDE